MIARLARWWRSVRLPRPSAAEWDAAFADGRWAFLAGRAESARLALVAHYVRLAAGPGATILDLGCGEGLLADAIAHLPYGRYLGVDLSGVAIERAQARASTRNRFEAGDAAAFLAPESPDVVVLNEILYYLDDPAAVARRLLAGMRPGGAVVVSIYDKPKTRPLWRALARVAETVDEVRLANAAGTRWRIAWLRARPPTVSRSPAPPPPPRAAGPASARR